MAERRLIISLTSYPQRIDRVHLVVESLYRQTVKADEIILYLSLEEFPKAEDNLPDCLRELIGKRGFRIEWVEDNLKSHKKYYYALQEYRENTVITVDDDIVYAESMISDFIRECRRFPNAILARRVRIMLKREKKLESYRKWDVNLDEYAALPRMDLCAIGVGGICYPPRTGNENWFRKGDMISMAENQDDLWLKFNEILDGIPVVYALPSQKDTPISDAIEDSLSHSNLNGGNDVCANVLLERMKNKNPSHYGKWFQGLMTWEEYAAQKKNYCRNVLKADFDKLQNAPIYFYGAGKRAAYILERLSALQLTSHITAVVVSGKTGNPLELEGIKVRQLDEVDKGKSFGVIFGVNQSNRKQIEMTLKGYDYCSIELNEQALEGYFNIVSRWRRSDALHKEK